MAYSIFASGTGGYTTWNHQRFADEGDVYDLGDAMGEAAERGNVDLGGQSDAHRIATDALGTISSVHILEGAIEAMWRNGRSPEIWLLARSPGTLWGIWDQPWYEQDWFYFEGESETTMTRNFVRCLHNCRLNRWGIMGGIAGIISDYATHIVGNRPSPSILTMTIEV